MPSKTERQRRAMRAAAAGKSTLGIPQDVGEEFVKADRAQATKKKKKKRVTKKKATPLPRAKPSKRPRVKKLPKKITSRRY